MPSRLVSGAKGGTAALARLDGRGRYDTKSVSWPRKSGVYRALWRKSYQVSYQTGGHRPSGAGREDDGMCHLAARQIPARMAEIAPEARNVSLWWQKTACPKAKV